MYLDRFLAYQEIAFVDARFPSMDVSRAGSIAIVIPMKFRIFYELEVRTMENLALRFIRWGTGLLVLGLLTGYGPLGHYLMGGVKMHAHGRRFMDMLLCLAGSE